MGIALRISRFKVQISINVLQIIHTKKIKMKPLKNEPFFYLRTLIVAILKLAFEN